MRVTIVSAGTRGDTQPFVVLAEELIRRGHEVDLAVSPNTLDLVHRAGLSGRGVGPDSQAAMDSPRAQQALASGRTGEVGEFLLAELLGTWDTAVDIALEACAGADVVLAAPLAADFTSVATDALGLPLVNVHLNPVLPNTAHAHPLVTVRRLPRPLAYGAGLMFERAWWRTIQEQANASRTRLGLARVRTPLRRRASTDLLAIQAWDRVLTPTMPTSARAPLVGFLAPDPATGSLFGEDLDPDLLAWLDAGEPPVFFGFGSMPVTDPASTVRIVVDAARRRGVRALVSAGWSRMHELEPDGDDVLLVGAVDHRALLPRCAAAVHHGGAGTTGASLRAGAPTVVCGVLADQFLWGVQMEHLGVGAALPFAGLSVDGLDRALEIALRPETRERVHALADRMVPGVEAVRTTADLVETAAR
jgi:sterol 3beta-glucosyltransferase